MFFILTVLAFPMIDDNADLAKERRRFVGTWELTQVIKDGKVEEEPVGGKTYYVFSADGTYVGKVGNSNVGKGTFKPLPGTNPTALDWTTASRQEFDGKYTRDYPAVGLYRFNGDILTIVLRHEGKPEDRPKDFDCKPGSHHYLIKLKKQ
ncbi:MAG: TIGR03067 domain-containing protein [Gemmatales bacterium]